MILRNERKTFYVLYVVLLWSKSYLVTPS